MPTVLAQPSSKPHQEQLLGLPIDSGIMFSDHKKTRKKRIERRQTGLLGKLSFIEPFLQDNERILLVTTACSPVSFFEQLTTGVIFTYLKRSLLVFTNERIFHIPTKTSYSYRNSIAHLWYADCETMTLGGHVLTVQYKTGEKDRFLYIAVRERKKSSRC